MVETTSTTREARWAARPRAALAVRAAAFLVPLLVAVAVAAATKDALTWAGVAAAATAAAAVTGLLTRRLLPVATLLRLSLPFPGEAPSRFAVALRSHSPRSLRARLEDLRTGGPGAEPAAAARTLVDLTVALDRHDRATRGHAERVRAYARLIGEELGYDEAKLDLLDWAALVHDAGKLAVPARLLAKRGPLTDEERELVRTHAAEGAALVAPLRAWFGEWDVAVGAHHERWDGTGYPRALEGEDIPIAARIVAVADAFDVLTSARSYKWPVGVDAARQEISECSGSQFDPTIVRAFLNVAEARLARAMGAAGRLARVPILRPVPLAPVAAVLTGVLATAAVAAAASLGGGSSPSSPAPREEPRVVAAAEAPAAFDAAGPSDDRPTTTIPGPATLDPTTLTTTTRATSQTGDGDGDAGEGNGGGSGPTDDGPTFESPGSGGGTSNPGPVPFDPNAAVADDAVTIDEDTVAVVDVLANDRGVGLLAVGPPPVGAAAVDGQHVVYLPPADWSGQVTVQYLATTPAGQLLGGNVLIDVLPTPDAPRAATGTLVVLEDQAATVPVLDGVVDPDGDPVALVGVDAPAKGTATVEGDTVRYQPHPDANGTDTFAFEVADATGLHAHGVVVVEIVPVNDRPRILARFVPAVDEDSGPVVVPGWVIATPGPPDESSQLLTATVTVDQPHLFSVPPAVDLRAGTLTYTPAPNASGTATMTLTVTDDGGTAFGGLDTAVDIRPITLRPTNDPPVPGAGPHRTTDVGTTVVIPVLADDTDPENDPLHVVSVADPAHGTATTDGTTVTYTPDPGWIGTETFSYTIADVHGATATGTVTVTTADIDSPPDARPDSVTLPEDSGPVVIPVLANDVDPEGKPLRLVAVVSDGFELGSVVANPDGTVTFTPDHDEFGTGAFAYSVADEAGAVDTAAVTVTITPSPDAPAAGDDGYATTVDVPFDVAAPGVLGNDSDADGDTLTAALEDGADHGTVVLNPDGSLQYTPTAGFAGTDTFTYRVDDGTGASATATVTITVAASVDELELHLAGGPILDTTWPMAPAPAASMGRYTDTDGDGDPGKSIHAGGQDLLGTLQPEQHHDWVYAPAAPLTLDGPVRLHLFSSARGFDPDTDLDWSVAVLDCAAGSKTDCTPLLLQERVHVEAWNGGATDWVEKELNLGSIAGHTIAPGRELRIRLMVGHDRLWVAHSAELPSRLVVTTAP